MEIEGANLTKNHADRELLIYPDLTPGQGFVSFSNCFEIAQQWSTFGSVRFALSANSPNLARKRIAQAGFLQSELSCLPGALPTFVAFKHLSDLYQPAAAVIDGTDMAKQVSTSQKLLLQNTLWLKAPDIACNPQFFISRNRKCRDRRKHLNVARRIAVMDLSPSELQLATRVVNTLEQIEKHRFSIDLIIARHSQHRQEIRQLASASKHHIQIHSDVSRLVSLVERLDLGIATYGPGCLFLAANGIPQIVFSSPTKAFEKNPSLEDSSAVELVGSDTDSSTLRATIESLVTNKKKATATRLFILELG